MSYITKPFSEIPIGAYFYTVNGDGKIKSYRKESIDSGIDITDRSIKEFNLYDEVTVLDEPKFVLNY